MPQRATPPPPQYADLDDFLWHDFEDAAEWAAWVHARGRRAHRADAFASAKQLHAALRSLEEVNSGATPAAAPVKQLDALVARFDVRPAVDEHGRCSLVAASGLVPALLVVALGAMADGTWKRFKRCRDATCRASFYDVSKSATRTWCSMERCGSRAKMRRFRTGVSG